MRVLPDKKIGIITFHRPVNAGAFLQSYALATIVKKLGFEPEIIDYYSRQQEQHYSKLYPSTANRSFKHRVFFALYRLPLLLFAHRIRRYYKEYHAFVGKHLPISRRQYRDVDGLKAVGESYEAYISGSDQIWNVSLADFSEAYLLDFVTGGRKRIAYAPSLGKKKYFPNKYANLIKKYDHVSVREKAGAQYMSKLIGRNVPYVLDPTFLLELSDYDRLEQPSGITGDYLFFYAIGPSIRQRILVNKMAKKLGLKVVSWNPQHYVLDKLLIRNLVQPKIQNPGVWLNLIKNAKFVMPASFHGSVFSVMYGKDFSPLARDKDNRLEIFKEFILNYKTLQNGDLPQIFTPDDVNTKRLEELKTSSLNYLRSALNE